MTKPKPKMYDDEGPTRYGLKRLARVLGVERLQPPDHKVAWPGMHDVVLCETEAVQVTLEWDDGWSLKVRGLGKRLAPDLRQTFRMLYMCMWRAACGSYYAECGHEVSDPLEVPENEACIREWQEWVARAGK